MQSLDNYEPYTAQGSCAFGFSSVKSEKDEASEPLWLETVPEVVNESTGSELVNLLKHK